MIREFRIKWLGNAVAHFRHESYDYEIVAVMVGKTDIAEHLSDVALSAVLSDCVDQWRNQCEDYPENDGR